MRPKCTAIISSQFFLCQWFMLSSCFLAYEQGLNIVWIYDIGAIPLSSKELWVILSLASICRMSPQKIYTFSGLLDRNGSLCKAFKRMVSEQKSAIRMFPNGFDFLISVDVPRFHHPQSPELRTVSTALHTLTGP